MSRDRTGDLRSTASRLPTPVPRGGGANRPYGTGSSTTTSRDANNSYANERGMEMGRYVAAPGSQYGRGTESSRETGRYPQPVSTSYSNGSSYNREPERSRYPANSYSGGSAAPARSGGSSLDNFLDEVQSTKRGIDRVSENVQRIERLHQKALLGTSPDEQAHYTQQVDALQDETGDLIQTLRATVKGMAGATKTAPPTDAPIRQKQQAALAESLMSVARQYQEAQLKSKQKYRQRMEREIRIARPDASSDEIAQALDSNSGSVFSQQLLSSRVGAQRAALAEVQTRHQEISRIEQSINELFTLFQEMQGMLEQQQETIDAIETHVEDTHVYIEEGNKEMTQAIVHRKSSRKKAWWILACVIILLIIIAVVVYIQVVKPALDVKAATSK
ncbi:t-SNARE [Powellomyces hirtus]|nr:t-SNARE [Powellomyces hirtus]